MNELTFSVSDAHKLEDPERQKWLPPNEVITSLELQSGMLVADIGAGTGYFTLPIARTVGSGKVHAVDFQIGMLEILGKKLLEPNAPTNIILVHGTATHITLHGPSICGVISQLLIGLLLAKVIAVGKAITHAEMLGLIFQSTPAE